MSGIKFKVCGIISNDEANKLLKTKVNYIGLNFVNDSQRRITIEIAVSIVGTLKNSGIKIVLLFRDQPLALVNEYSIKLDADFVQLHGSESVKYSKQVNTPVIKAVAINSSSNPESYIDYISKYPARYFVLDREQQGKGDVVNLQIAGRIINEFPGRIFIAGGLNPNNLYETIEKAIPFGIDIASGIRTNNNLDIKKVNEVLRIISAT